MSNIRTVKANKIQPGDSLVTGDGLVRVIMAHPVSASCTSGQTPRGGYVQIEALEYFDRGLRVFQVPAHYPLRVMVTK